jgi:hypothetical protein
MKTKNGQWCKWLICDNCGRDFVASRNHWGCPYCHMDMTPNRENAMRASAIATQRYAEAAQQRRHNPPPC